MAHSPHARRGPPLGLKNLGNSCYLNSVLQCLSYTGPLAQFCLSSSHSSLCKSLFPNRDKDCPFCILERQIIRCHTLDSAVDAPFKIQKCLTLFAEHFRSGRQEDAHEFLRYAIDTCHNTCLKLHNARASPGSAKPAVRSVMSEIFGGALLSQVKCLSCKGESNKTDEIMDISLDIYQCSSLKNALGRFFQSEVLDGNNKYSCGKCNKMVVAKKQIFMLRPPNVLVIQLKRFEGSGKINRNIEFEEILVLSKFMYKASQESQPEYNLFGSIVHSGFSPESGHYYAYVKDALGRWYCCNDAYVSLSSTQEVLSEKVYILFYMRTNQYSRPSNSDGPIKTNSPSNGLKASNSNALIRNGKTSPSQQIKTINMRNLGLKRVIENGKGNLEGQSDSSVEKSSTNIGQLKEHKESPEYSSMDESKMVDGAHVYPEANGNDANGNAYSDLEEQHKKQNLLVSNGVECDDLLKAKVREGDDNQLAATVKRDPVCEQSSDRIIGNGFGPTSLLKVGSEDDDKQVVTAVKREPDHDHSSNSLINKHESTSASKRELCDAERGEVQALYSTGSSSSMLTTDVSCTKISNKRKHPPELEAFKELLARNAYSHLCSGDWADAVHNFMRNRKRICTQESGSCLDNDELRKQLITDARKVLPSQIPLSLKAHLIGALRSFFEGNYISDA